MLRSHMSLPGPMAMWSRMVGTGTNFVSAKRLILFIVIKTSTAMVEVFCILKPKKPPTKKEGSFFTHLMLSF